jgi:hypothetical protein
MEIKGKYMSKRYGKQSGSGSGFFSEFERFDRHAEKLKRLNETGRKIYDILQLRVHPVIISLKKRIEKATASEKYDIILTKMAPWNWQVRNRPAPWVRKIILGRTINFASSFCSP